MSDTVKRKPIEATKTLKKVMADHFYELDNASKKGSPKIAWCTSVGPAELLRSFGFLVYFPENHGAMLGATRLAMKYIPVANAIGYSPDICSYLTSDIGAFLKNETPLQRAYNIDSVPKADILVYNTNQCRDVQDWFAFYARKWNVPIVGVHTYRNLGKIREHHIKEISEQFKDMIPLLEEVSGNKFDMNRFREVVALSRDCSIMWRKVLETAAHKPSPLTFFDATIHMGPAVVARGTKEAVDYYELLLEELEDRITNGIAAVDN